LFILPLSLFYLENCICLSRGVQVAGVTWRVVIMIVARVGDLMQRTGDGHICRVLGSWAIERSSGIVCDLHHAHGDEEREFLG
jgi:hypothetical protein